MYRFKYFDSKKEKTQLNSTKKENTPLTLKISMTRQIAVKA